MTIMDDEQREQYESFKRVINLFNANPDLLRQKPEAIPALAQLIEAVVTIEALEAGAPELGRKIREADLEVLARAEALHATIAPYRSVFEAAGVKTEFVDRLEDYIDELRESLEIAED